MPKKDWKPNNNTSSRIYYILAIVILFVVLAWIFRHPL